MAAEILLDGKKPAELPVRTFDNGTATVNTEICEKLGLDFAAVKGGVRAVLHQRAGDRDGGKLRGCKRRMTARPRSADRRKPMNKKER